MVRYFKIKGWLGNLLAKLFPNMVVAEGYIFNADNLIAQSIVSTLKDFKDIQPITLIYSKNASTEDEDYVEKVNSGEATDDTEWALDELIWTFQALSGNDAADELLESHQLFLEELGHVNGPKVWKNNPEGRQKYYEAWWAEQERTKRGLKLFAEVFRGLWE